MAEWITINLPWTYSYAFFRFDEPEPDYSEKEKEMFGMSYQDVEGELDAEDLEADRMGELENLLEKIGEWVRKQPEWAAWYERREQAEQDWYKNKPKGFMDTDMCVPGTLIRLDDGTVHLIGTINTNGGTCDDCPAFDNETAIVEAYKPVLDFEKESKA